MLRRLSAVSPSSSTARRCLSAVLANAFSSDTSGGQNCGGTSEKRIHKNGNGSDPASPEPAVKARPRPRSPLAMAAFDYQEEVAERIRDEGTMPDAEAAFEILANHRIREAIAAGEFDNLPGKGEILDRTEDTSDIAMKVLKNANAAPEWVELGKDIREKITAIRARLRTWLAMNVEEGACQSEIWIQELKQIPGWGALEEELLGSINCINADIARHNHMAPTAVVHIMPLRLQAEVRSAAQHRSSGVK